MQQPINWCRVVTRIAAAYGSAFSRKSKECRKTLEAQSAPQNRDETQATLAHPKNRRQHQI